MKSRTEPVKMFQMCGYDAHADASQCPAKDKACLHCGIKGHFAKACRKKATGQKKPPNGVPMAATETWPVGAV